VISISLNQTESEKRLHRILYFVKYLRAMILNFVLTVLAIALYMTFGITGLYPGAEDTVNALRAQMDHPERYGGQLNPYFVPIVSTGTVLFLIAFFVWLYISITRVWRKSLKAQSIFSVIGIPVLYYSVVPQFRFSYNHLDPLFTILFGINLAFILWCCADLSIGLWKVSTSPDVYSFVATLDPRLTNGVWAHVNKLLDLPRTPLRTWRTGFAYLLSLGSYILLIACLMYFITLGEVSSKLGRLYPHNLENIPLSQCATLSLAWAKQIGLLLILAFIGTRLAILVQSSARKLGSLSVSEALGDSKRRYILYLRSFTVDEIILPKPRLPLLSKVMYFRPFPAHIEEELFDVTDGYLPLIAVGRPGGSQELIGGLAYRDYLKDENWQTYVRDKILAADSIVLLLNSTGGVLWELENVLNHSAFAKTVFLIDPRAKDKELWQNLTKRIIPMFAKAGVLAPDFQFAGHPIGFYFSGDGLVEVENTNWSATSYRTALSHYLSERARP
jgi:hypothetical protein